MKREDVIKILKGYKQRLDTSCSNQLDVDKEAFDFAIDAIETGEIYMTGKDYNLFLEGYKQGKKDFERPRGRWIQTEILNDDGEYGVNDNASECSNCKHIESSHYWTTAYYHYCPNCGASMQKGGAV